MGGASGGSAGDGGATGGSAGDGAAGGGGHAVTKKWYPGHYIYVSLDKNFDSVMDESKRTIVKDNPNFTGYHNRYSWAALENAKDEYDFSLIEADLETARSDGKKLIVHVHDRNHQGTDRLPVPEYLTTDPVYAGGVYVAEDTAAGNQKLMPKIWNAGYAERLGALLRALGEAFDDDTALAYVCLEETALPGAKEQPDFTADGLRDGYLTIHAAAGEGLPRTLFSQYVNWGGGLSREGADDVMDHLVHTVKGGFGAPDFLNAEHDGVTPTSVLDNWFGEYFEQYKGVAAITASSQMPSFQINSAQTVFDYIVDARGASFATWLPVRSDDLAWDIDDLVAVVDAENGRINATLPTNLLAP
jgi:hypothetical protein